MTTILKTLKKAVFITTTLFIISCSSEDGKEGLQGPAGNANVKQYDFGTVTFSTNHTYKIEGFSQKDFDESIFLAYHENSALPGVLYSTPGFGYLSNYQSRVNIVKYDSVLWFNIQLKTEDGSSNYNQQITFSKFKIFVIPSSLQTTLSGKSVNNLKYNELLNYIEFLNK